MGSGTAAAKSLDLADFAAIEVTQPFKLEVRHSDAFGVSITADDNVLGHIVARRQGRRLTIALEGGLSYRLRKNSLGLAVTLPSLEGIRLGEGARASLDGFGRLGRFEAEVVAEGTLEGTLDADLFICRVEHGGRVSLRGSAKEARLIARASGHLELGGLALGGGGARVDLEHNSSASLSLRSARRLEARLAACSTLIGDIEADEVAIEASHESRVRLAGSTRDAKLRATASSVLELGRLGLRSADVRIELGSSATVAVDGKLDYTVEGSSALKYLGGPAIGRAEASPDSSARSTPAED
ncbi:GIN domain-containing protein [Singulisphaera sp. PoT]|uniref:GIN domain-containing protein n=1 Tax=Singulisphaera sp. PoT TaxID=3411797 RepID=UPI003BF603B0